MSLSDSNKRFSRKDWVYHALLDENTDQFTIEDLQDRIQDEYGAKSESQLLREVLSAFIDAGMVKQSGYDGKKILYEYTDAGHNLITAWNKGDQL